MLQVTVTLPARIVVAVTISPKIVVTVSCPLTQLAIHNYDFETANSTYIT
jgi:hypothetical protein